MATIALKPSIKSKHWDRWLGILGLGLLFVALRWNNYAAPLGRDEGEYAYSAQVLIQGLAPYQHAFMQKPPGIIYCYALCDLLAPGVFWAPRILAAVFAGLAIILLGYIARLDFGKEVALPAMWLAAPMILLPGLDQIIASVETFMLLPLLGTVAVYYYSRQHLHKNIHWLAAGFLAATTLLFKYTALLILAFVFVAWVYDLWRKGASANSIFGALASAAAGGILALALGLAFFLIRDGGRTFWECTVVFNRYYAGSVIFSTAFFWSKCKDFWDNWWILFLMPWAVLLQPRPRLWFWLGMFFCAAVATNASCYGQYYIPMMPFWALLSAAGICALAVWLSQRLPRISSGAFVLVTIVVMLLVIRSDVPWLLYSGQRFVFERWAKYPFIEAQAMADQVSRRSSPNDFVFVAGSEPEILYNAQRFSPTRFITSYPLMDPTPLAPGYQQEAIRDLLSHPPKLIVFVQEGDSWTRQSTTPPQFFDFMGRFLGGYNLMSGYVKGVSGMGYWTTNLNAAEYQSSSLLLYEQKPAAGEAATANGTSYSH